MDDWGFGIWVVPVALSAALCYAGADYFASNQSTLARSFHLFLVVCSRIGLRVTAALVTMHLFSVL
jgi:hypothetical protein